MKNLRPQTIDQYISGFPKEVGDKLVEIRTIIGSAAPLATEKISYSIPTFYLNGNLVHFAAFKNHIGFYAFPESNEAFKIEFSSYKCGKGSVQFPFDQPLPEALIKKIVRFRVEENLKKAI